MTNELRVLGLATYPSLAAATRHRILQYVPLLAREGVTLDVRPFLSNRVFAGLYDRRRVIVTSGGILAGVGRRVLDAMRLGSYDVVYVQGMAALIGPPILEWLAKRKLPFVVDLDDATYIERGSEVFGSIATTIKGRGKAERLIRWADHVVAGNPTIAAHAVAHYGKPTTVLPTIVDVERFTPRQQRDGGELVIGWMGTHSTFSYLRTLTPVFQRLARSHAFVLRVIGAGAADVHMDGVKVEALRWSVDRELADLQSFDIGVYPIVADAWAEGKSGFKAIQYLSCGIPYVASPVGVVATIGIAGVTHLEARGEDEWIDALTCLIEDGALRARMGERGRAYAVEHYSVPRAAHTLAEIFREVAAKKTTAPEGAVE